MKNTTLASIAKRKNCLKGNGDLLTNSSHVSVGHGHSMREVANEFLARYQPATVTLPLQFHNDTARTCILV